MTGGRPRHLRDLTDQSVDTIVLVPGIDGTAELFYRQIPLLASSFNVVAFPLPDKPAATMDELVDDLVLLIRETSAKPVLLCGESFGGALAMSVALARPELVKGLIIINSFPYLENRLQLALAPRIVKLLPWVAMPAVRRLTEHRLHSAHALDEDLHEFRVRMRGIGRDGYIRRLELLMQYDIRARLAQLAMPVLFLAGTDDKLVPSARWAQYMAARVPGGRVLLLEGYGHCCLINHDLDLAQLVREWWSDQSQQNEGGAEPCTRRASTDGGRSTPAQLDR